MDESLNEVPLGPDAEIRHELDAEGRDAGVEREDVDDDEIIREPFDPRLIDVTTEMRSCDTLMKRLAIGQIDLDPDFQRSRGIWTVRKQSQLIESLLLRIPLPTFYVAEVDTPNAKEALGLGDSRWAVVDGIQRLSTIAQFVIPDARGETPLRLHGLQYLSEGGKSFGELSQSLQLRILESQFTIQVIRKTTPEAVKLNIFARINTGGVPLSQQELRHALTPGPARALLRRLAMSEPFQVAVSRSVSPSRMVDREMVLRFLAFRISDPADYRMTDFDNFLTTAMRTINGWSSATLDKQTAAFENVMKTVSAVFRDDAFRKRYRPGDPRRPVSKALFETVSVAIATSIDTYGSPAIDALTQNRERVKAAFMHLMTDAEFDRSISQGTGDPGRVRYRFGRLNEMIDAVGGSPRH